MIELCYCSIASSPVTPVTPAAPCCGSASLRYSAFPQPAHAACGQWQPLMAGITVSYLLDGFESRDCGERCGRHFPHIHVHVAAVLAHGQRWIFFRHVLGLFDIFRGLFHLRLAVDNRVGHFIQVMSIPLAENCEGAWCCGLFADAVFVLYFGEIISRLQERLA